MSSPAPNPIPGPNAESRPLPGYRALLAVDAKDFTGLASIQHSAVSMVITELVDRALTAAGLTELRDTKSFPNNTGDGIVFGFDPRHLPFVVFPFLRTLDGLLGRHNGQYVSPRLRLRASVHVGPLPEADGNGTARNDTHRLLDSRPVKAILAMPGSEHTTHLAAILSQRVYEDVVLGGYAGLGPDHFIEVPATVDGKPFAQRAWLHIPSPSGHLLRHGILSTIEESAEPAPAAPEPPRPAAPGPTQNVEQGYAIIGDVQGGISGTFGARP
ncbi:hypothetical protein [Streptomyces marincola]|uniref:Guanylate cyclase domain-containing protein n=1 Tax=Streptomyces marincola TaxID=2878388 RepID=A0A1W7CYV4_9ACTN|nr:hypothetical protein [Streptomyces marincola]ARQ69988.1 hypothetical protein CAG99_14985 [Streptomyces marincola]